MPVVSFLAVAGAPTTAGLQLPPPARHGEINVPEDTTSPKSSNPNPPPSGGKRILLVDDHADSVKSLSMLMRLWKHDVQSAYDGPSAISLALEFLPQVVLLDIGLPGMSGYEVATHLRSQAELAGTLLVAMTGFARDEDRQRAVEAGFDHHLVKPVAAETLKQFLESVN